MNICVLGSTGSIGQSTLDVIARHPARFGVYALTANERVDLLAAQCAQFQPKYAVMSSDAKAEQLKQQLAEQGQTATEVLSGVDGLCQVASAESVDTVMAAIVGGAGLAPTMAAVNAGKKVLLANKESLVMAGALFMDAVKHSGAQLLPIDSEHNAIFQCLPPSYNYEASNSGCRAGVRKILLSGSGGPFRTTPVAELAAVTPQQACNHPNWDMGRKISVDSATMMNKGLELIEACWLFGVSPRDIEIVIHPQSIIHSLVEYIDGSVLAQMGNPDMRTPIAHALAWPERIESGVAPLNLLAADLTFDTPDFERFPCLALAIRAAENGLSEPVVLNAANEVAVDAFLNGRAGFTDIAKIVEQVLNQFEHCALESLERVQRVDQQARLLAEQQIAQLAA